MVAPALCSSFKGVLPSELRMKYSQEGGRHMMEIDLAVASEISERIAEQTDQDSPAAASRKATKAVHRRNQRRAATIDGKGLGEALNEAFGNMEND